MTDVCVVDYGAGNLRSLRHGLERAGATVTVTADADRVAGAARVLVPGVGAAGAAMAALERRGLRGAILAAAAAGGYVFGICLGMQLLFESSDEGDVECLGLLPGRVTAMGFADRLPHMGWNDVVADRRPSARGRACRRCATSPTPTPSSRRPPATSSPPPSSTAAGSRRWPARSASPGRSSTPRRAARQGGSSCVRSCAGAAMLRRRVIPCLDVRGGRLVKGVQFRELRDCGDPVVAAERYAAAGADEIVWLNIDAHAEAWQELLRAVERAAERVDVPLCVGGGIDRPERARELLLAGADKISVNSAALRTPGLIDTLAEMLGTQCVVVAMDAARGDGGWWTYSRGGMQATGIEAIGWAEEVRAARRRRADRDEHRRRRRPPRV